MKAIHYSILFVPLLMACGGGEEAEEQTEETTTTTENTVEEPIVEEVLNSFTIEGGTVGVFTVGEMVPETLPEELKMRQFNEEDIDDEGNAVEHTHNVIFNYLEDVVELIMEKGDEHHEDKMIVEMYVLTNYYETAEGITVGSTINDFLTAYESNTIWYDGIHDRYYMEADMLEGVQFILSNEDADKTCKTSKEFKEIDFSYFGEEAEIAKIRVL